MAIEDTPLDQELTFTGVDLLDLDTEKHATNPLSHSIRAIRCKPVSGAAGTVRFLSLAGTIRTTEIAVGETIMVGATHVKVTGTTATGLEGIV